MGGRTIAALLFVLLAAGACGKEPAPQAAAPGACRTAAECPAGQECVQGRCMTNLTRTHESVDAARRAREQVQDGLKAIDQQRDRAIDGAGR